MAKKSNISIPGIAVIRSIVFLLIGLTIYFIYVNTADFLTESDIFTVHDVVIDKSIQFIDVAELKRLKGHNIFKVDIARLQAKIKAQYPQIAQLQVMRELPDRIKVLAKKRDVIFQAVVHGKSLLVDTEGVGMYFSKEAVDVPLVIGLVSQSAKIVLGAPLAAKSTGLAVTLIRTFKARPVLSGLKVVSLDISNLSKIEITLAQGVHIILDQDNYAAKLDLLAAMLEQKKIMLAQLKYLDLRFNEPVLKENDPVATTR